MHINTSTLASQIQASSAETTAAARVQASTQQALPEVCTPAAGVTELPAPPRNDCVQLHQGMGCMPWAVLCGASAVTGAVLALAAAAIFAPRRPVSSKPAQEDRDSNQQAMDKAPSSLDVGARDRALGGPAGDLSQPPDPPQAPRPSGGLAGVAAAIAARVSGRGVTPAMADDPRLLQGGRWARDEDGRLKRFSGSAAQAGHLEPQRYGRLSGSIDHLLHPEED